MECVSKIKEELLSEALDQRTVRNLKKVIENLEPSNQELLLSEVTERLRLLLQNDPVTALKCVSLFSSGCQLLQQCVNEFMSEILSFCTAGLQIEQINEVSRFQISAKALYGVFQSPYVQNHSTLKNVLTTNQLQLLLELLIFAVADNNLPSDCALVVATLLSMVYSCLVKNDLHRRFPQLLKIIESYEQDQKKEAVKTSVEQLQESNFKEDEVLGYGDIKTSYPLVLAVNGLLNSGVQWIYFPLPNDEAKEETAVRIASCSYECVATGEQESVTCRDEYFESNTQSYKKREPVFLYNLYPLFSKSCRDCASYSFLAFQGLLAWLQSIRKRVKEYEQLCGCPGKNCTPCICPSKQELFGIHLNCNNCVFHLLNANWESPSKGVSDTVYKCMAELIELHEDTSPGQAKLIAMEMVANLVLANSWNLKSTYPPLALAISFGSADVILQQHPTIPESLLESLTVNYLGPAGANVFKIILSQLESSVWSKHFLSIIIKALHSPDRMVRQNALTLWLPVTIRQYPTIYVDLLKHCQQSSPEGWLARMAILKVARACGQEDVLGNINMKLPMEDNCERIPTEGLDEISKKNHDECVSSVSSSSLLQYAISHLDETVRSEALAFLCQTKKASQPVTQEEAALLKQFFFFNMNIDSAPYRQNIIRCCKALVIRLRDACAGALKNPSYSKVPEKCDNEVLPLENIEKDSILFINGELLLWLLFRFHANLEPGCNYQRRILSLQLYKETLLAFYEFKGSRYTFNKRFSSVLVFLNTFSKFCKSSVENSSRSPEVCGLTLLWTHEMLLWCCLDEMDDIRNESENILKILEVQGVSENGCNLAKWFHLGLDLCNSPKSSDAESGASIVKTITSIQTLHLKGLLRESNTLIASETILQDLYDRVKTQFQAAQNNLLLAARNTPIHGSLLALGRCLCEHDDGVQELAKETQDSLPKLLELMVELVEFMLNVLAKSSKKGSEIAPSFAEMGESIEMVIKECKVGQKENPEGEVQQSGEETGSNITSSYFDEDEANEDETAISSDHSLVLSCCWQTMKVCCLVSSMCVSRWLNFLTEGQVEMILSSVVIRVLTGTRHKGAMEAARTCYSQLSILLLNTNSSFHHLIHRQVDSIITQLKSGAQTSITRRAAGVAMMVQVACGAAPRTNKLLIDSTVSQLINITETEYEEQNTVDSPPVLALHILHSLVIYAPLAHHLVQQMPEIAVSCLKAFGSKSWAIRNAALQLYGAVVPRMVGQKKVRDDSSTLNSLTASEFLSRHEKLADYLLKLLQTINGSTEECERASYGNISTLCLDENDPMNDIHENEISVEERSDEPPLAVHSHLVPVLSLLARLSPGTGLQQTQDINNRLRKYSVVIMHLLGSPIHTVRRLAALSIVALTPSEQAVIMIQSIVDLFRTENVPANEMHGKLLVVLEFLKTYESVSKDSNLKDQLILVLQRILKERKCYINATLSLKIFKLLQESNLEIDQSEVNSSRVGAPQYVYTALKSDLKYLSDEEIEKFLIEDVFMWQSVEEHFITHLECHLGNHTSDGWMENTEITIWHKLENLDNCCSTVLVRILCSILNRKFKITKMPSEKCIENLLLLLKSYHGAKIASKSLLVVAYIIKGMHDERWTKPETDNSLISSFCFVISKYSSPSSTEDYRFAASEALKISIPTLLLHESITAAAEKEEIIVAVLELLQDEDSTIRESSCQIVFHLQRNFLPSIKANSCLKNQIQEVVHSNLALRYFIEIVAKLCMDKNCNLLSALWKFSYKDTACKYKPKLALFQSVAVNLYRESRYCGQHIAKAVEALVKEHFEEKKIHQTLGAEESIVQWLKLECETLNSQGNFLVKLLREDDNLILNKHLLSVTYMYITAYETLESIGHILGINPELTCPISFKEGKFCVIEL